MLVLEEAHRLLRNAEPGTPAAHAVEIFANMLAEVRAYGEGIVVAEQIPAKIVPDVVKNSALKVMHRLPSIDDRTFVGATMNLDEEQSQYVVALPRGRAAVHVDEMDHAVLVDVDATGRHRESDIVDPGIVKLHCARPSCSERCRQTRCTLTEIAHTTWATQHYGLRLWADLAVVGHLIGRETPCPSRAWLEATRDRWSASLQRRVNDDRIECALGQLVDDAVRRRVTVIQPFYDPDALAAHVAHRLAAMWLVDEDPCGLETPWLVDEWRWCDVARALASAAANDDVDRPHPLTGSWNDRGLKLGGATWKEQLDEVIIANIQLSRSASVVLFGSPPLSAPDHVGDDSEGDARVRLEQALAELEVVSVWPLYELYPDEAPV